MDKVDEWTAEFVLVNSSEGDVFATGCCVDKTLNVEVSATEGILVEVIDRLVSALVVAVEDPAKSTPRTHVNTGVMKRVYGEMNDKQWENVRVFYHCFWLLAALQDIFI